MTAAQSEALRWFKERGGDGCFVRGGLVLSRGEIAPHTAATWKALQAAGAVQRYQMGQSNRLRIASVAHA